jgi:aminoglycoside phosphotransferase (APT) family kinase protein
MSKPWVAEHAVDEQLARALIETQFPRFAPVTLELLGVGWDNTAFLANKEFVFRFPRRQIAVALLETERRLLPEIAPKLPLPVPIPEFHGQPAKEYPWPFAGYKLLPGRSASAAALDESQRLRSVEALARFLCALHSLPTADVARLGAGPDVLGRLEVTRRAARARERLEALLPLGLVKNAPRVIEALEAATDPLSTPPQALVHGDFHAAHLLVDAAARPCGVIDWGDVHLGHPALDLALAFGFLPPRGRERFEQVYGSLEEETRRLARFKALETGLALIAYGHDVGQAHFVSEGQTALFYAVQ